MRRFLAGGDAIVGEPAPDFSLPIAAGDDGASRVRLSDLRGRTVVLEFWATWCPPCRGQMPEMARLRRETRSRPVDVIGINVEPGLAFGVIADRARAWRGDYLHLRDDGDVALAYRVESLPTVVLIDPDGIVAAVHRGPASIRELRALVASAAER
ncbi:MAG: TlpA family protein disulfide reductase [Deltaproteobacteria bacterium]|nr:TlpA family protein disulfide reductase [Deltaproteobacteria bacterium]